MKSAADMTVTELIAKVDKIRSGGGTVTREDGSRAVLVCTAKKGVFFGYTRNTLGEDIRLTNARMCIYWRAIGGVLGLQEIGPGDSCRIGATVSNAGALPKDDITYIGDCTAAAEARWVGAATYDAG